MHLKRQKVPKSWPIHRKGTKYVVRPTFNIKNGVPVLIFLRDMLKVAQNRKEVKIALHNKHVLLNDKPVKNEKNSILLFDKINLVPAKKYYNLSLSEHGKFEAEEIKESEAHQKITKIINKKILKNKKTQLNLIDGINSISEIKCAMSDSIIFDFKQKKIIKVLQLKEKSKVIVFAGKHTGKKGTIKKINSEKKMVELDFNGEKISVLIKQLMIIE